MEPDCHMLWMSWGIVERLSKNVHEALFLKGYFGNGVYLEWEEAGVRLKSWNS